LRTREVLVVEVDEGIEEIEDHGADLHGPILAWMNSAGLGLAC
jgi:hypothetical protein